LHKADDRLEAAQKEHNDVEFNGIDAGPRTYVRVVPICATFENGKSNMQATAAFQETAAFAAVLGAAIALIAAYSLWTLSGRK
jgi:hypothetical protein